MDPNTNHIRKIRFYGTFNYRPIAIFAIGLLLGILAIRLSSQLFIIAAALCTVTTMLAFRLKRKFVFLLSIAALFGMFRVCILRPAVYTIEDDSPFVEGTVHSIIEDNLILSSVSLNSMPVEGHMLIKNMQHSLKVGDTVCLTASVEQTSELRESTYKYYLLSENYTFVATPLYPIRTTGHTTSLHSAFAEAHNTLSCKIDSLFGSSSQIVKGILLGDTSQIPDDTLGNLQDTGIAHLLALSGLHVSILAGALSFALKRVNKYVKTGIIFTFLLVYCAITAFPASLVRASIMTAISMTAPLFNRRNDSLTSCAIALIVILVINPFQLFAAGFVLSFCAVTGIILMYKPFCNMFATVTEPWLYRPLAVSIAATSGTLPATTAYFHRMPIYGLVVNLLAVPVSSIAVVCAFAGLFIGFISETVAFPCVFIAETLLDGILYMTSAVASLPFAVITTQSLSFTCGLLYFLRMLCMSPYYITKPKARLRISIGLTVATFASFFL